MMFAVSPSSLVVHAIVSSSLKSNPPMIADDLRRKADTLIDLDDPKVAVGRTLEAVEPRNVRE
jgi:hypothetical protein